MYYLGVIKHKILITLMNCFFIVLKNSDNCSLSENVLINHILTINNT